MPLSEPIVLALPAGSYPSERPTIIVRRGVGGGGSYS